MQQSNTYDKQVSDYILFINWHDFDYYNRTDFVIKCYTIQYLTQIRCLLHKNIFWYFLVYDRFKLRSLTCLSSLNLKRNRFKGFKYKASSRESKSGNKILNHSECAIIMFIRKDRTKLKIHHLSFTTERSHLSNISSDLTNRDDNENSSSSSREFLTT